jgi:hypothetical protein
MAIIALVQKHKTNINKKNEERKGVKVPKRISIHVFLSNDDGNGQGLLQQYNDIVVELMRVLYFYHLPHILSLFYYFQMHIIIMNAFLLIHIK